MNDIRGQLEAIGVLDAVDALIAVAEAAQHRWAAGATLALAEARAAGLLEEDA